MFHSDAPAPRIEHQTARCALVRMVRDRLCAYFPRLSAAERSREAFLATLSQCSREVHDTPKRFGVRPALCTALSRSSVDLRRRSDHSGT